MKNSLTLDRCLIIKPKNEIPFNPRFLWSQRLGFLEFYMNENVRKWWWWIVIMNTIFLSIKTTTTQDEYVCVCVCVCVFRLLQTWVGFLPSFFVSKRLNNMFFILLNFLPSPPPPRNQAGLLGTSWVAWENR